MKHKLNLILVVGMLAGFITPTLQHARGSPVSPTIALAAEQYQQSGGMPGWIICT